MQRRLPRWRAAGPAADQLQLTTSTIHEIKETVLITSLFIPRPERAASGICALVLSLGLAAHILAPTAAHAADNGITVGDPWVRTIIPARPAAGYFTLVNKTTKPAELVGASSPDCGTLMLHQSVNQGGVETMVTVKSIAVPAGGQVQFAPGGYHLMCVQPTPAVTPGHSMPVTLHFQDGGTITANFPIHGAMGK
jgi:copper(I)-binding protein